MHGTCIAACSHRMKLYYQRLVQALRYRERPVAPPHRGKQQALSLGAILAMSLLHCGDAESRSNRPDIYTDSTERSRHDDQDTTTSRRKHGRATIIFLKTQCMTEEERHQQPTRAEGMFPLKRDATMALSKY